MICDSHLTTKNHGLSLHPRYSQVHPSLPGPCQHWSSFPRLRVFDLEDQSMQFGSQDSWGSSLGWRLTYLNFCHRESLCLPVFYHATGKTEPSWWFHPSWNYIHYMIFLWITSFSLRNPTPQKNQTFICHWNPGWGVDVWSSTQTAEAREAFLLKRLGFFAHVPRRWKTAERRIFLFQFSNHIVVSCFLSLVILHTCHFWIFLGAEALNKKLCFKECNK